MLSDLAKCSMTRSISRGIHYTSMSGDRSCNRWGRQ